MPPRTTLRWLDWVVRDLGCRTRILMVADGLTFGDAPFGLGEAVGIVRAATGAQHPVEVTTAHRGHDPDADVTSFEFVGSHTVGGTARTIHDYEEIWLFASVTAGHLPSAEIDEIAKFMDLGGGVLAMGDHDALGANMCGALPRVGTMRHWYAVDAPPGGGTERMDTNVSHAGADPQFDLQSDNIPQRIYPAWHGDPAHSVPHQLLAFGEGAVTFLPDHPHEGRCVVPATLDPTEYPTDTTGLQVAPEIVAWGVSGGPGFRADKPAVVPTLFGVIGAYDGHRTNVGRVAVDSTWHHWININLNGAGATPLSAGTATNGLYDAAGDPTPEYVQIQAYFQNLVSWLQPNRIRLCWVIVRAIRLRYAWPLFEELSIDKTSTAEEIEAFGRMAFEIVRREDGLDRAHELVSHFAKALRLPVPHQAMLDPWLPADRTATNGRIRERLSATVLGGCLSQLARHLPEDPTRVQEALADLAPKKDGNGFDACAVLRLMCDGGHQALKGFADRIAEESRVANSICAVIPPKT